MTYSSRMVAVPSTEPGYRDLLVRVEGATGRIVLNRPDKRNALSLELMQEVIRALADLGGRGDVRAVVIEGAGVAFSAGHDLSEMVGRSLADYQRIFDVCTEMMEAIPRLP